MGSDMFCRARTNKASVVDRTWEVFAERKCPSIPLMTRFGRYETPNCSCEMLSSKKGLNSSEIASSQCFSVMLLHSVHTVRYLMPFCEKPSGFVLESVMKLRYEINLYLPRLPVHLGGTCSSESAENSLRQILQIPSAGSF